MDRPIEVGDLVMVVRGCPNCGECESLGAAFTVSELAFDEWACKWCHQAGDWCALDIDSDHCVSISQLIRIDPPALADETRQDERLTA